MKAAVIASVAVLLGAACVGSDPASTPAPPATNDDAGPTPSNDAGGRTDDGGPAQSCATGTADCDGNPGNGCETDTRTSPLHCGTCGRGCGAATCQAGECTVEKLRDGLDHPFSLELAGQRLLWHEPQMIRGCRADDCAASTAILTDIEGTQLPTVTGSPHQIAVIDGKFYFSRCPAGTNNDCAVASCDVTGCKLTGSTFVVAPSGNRRAPIVVGGPGAIYTHQGIDGLYKTDVVAKTVTPAGSLYKVGDILGAMAVSAQSFVYVDDNASQATPTGGVYLCPIAGCPGAPTLLLPPPVRLVAMNATAVFTSTGGSAAGTASIIACPLGGCGGGGKVLATNQAFVSDVAADDQAVYWTTTGVTPVTSNSSAIGTVMRCALPDCAGGPTKIAEGVTNPVAVRIDATYVYWLTHGTGANPNGAVFRRRR